MTPQSLRAHIKPLPEYLPRTKELERATSVGVGFDGAWYRSQKEHWLGWLAEYDGPGAYGRKVGAPRDAAYVYNHIQCAPMLFWLSEALGAPPNVLETAFKGVVAVQTKGAPQCAELRKALPWSDVERLFEQYGYSLTQMLMIKTSTLLQKNGRV